MARPMRADGTPYPRKWPVDWGVVRRVLRHRQEHVKIIKRGFVEVGHYGPWLLTDQGRKVMLDTCLHPDGARLYVKLGAK